MAQDLNFYVHNNFFTIAQAVDFFSIILTFLHHARLSCEGKQIKFPQKLYYYLTDTLQKNLFQFIPFNMF